ncbi:MAG TPA: ABC transporter permease, partial [Anaerolineales bacterium]|nr:ABC transporter permease [Anaerolineales bacterium]
ELPQVRIWDTGDSTLPAFLENSLNLEARSGYESRDQLLRRVGRASTAELGLAIPADFDAIVEAGGEPVLEAYLAYWVSPAKAVELISLAEEETTRLLGQAVRIDLSEVRAYPTSEDGGPGAQVSLALILVVVMVGVNMVPHLMLEEKQARTLDVLLVSPANETQVVLAKALTGLFYSSAGLAVALVLNRDLIVHWGVMVPILATLSLLMVSIGVWLGTKIDSRPQLMLWAWVFIVPAFLPVLLMLLRPLFPDVVAQILQVIPTATGLVALNQAYVQDVNWVLPLAASAWILVWAGAAIAATVWLMRRRGRASRRPEALAADRPEVAAREPRLPVKEKRTPVSAASLTTAEPGVTRPGGILLAIIAKDIKEALQNKTVLSILLGTLFVVLNGAALPALLELRWTPSAMVVDEGRSTILRGLATGEDLRLALADDREDMRDAITAGPGTWLGLVIPADFDERAGRGEPIELEGFVAHWASADRARETVAALEEALGLATWGPVTINLEGQGLYPTPDVGGQISIQLISLVLAVLIIGMMLVPLLMIEERETHTLDALLTSPAKLAHVIGGKAIVGIVYCFLAAAVVVLINRALIVHWEIVLLATLLTAVFAVSVGILIGLVATNATAVGFWGGPILMLMLVPVMLEIFVAETAPAIVRMLIDWSPSGMMMDLFRYSVAGEVPMAQLWLSAGLLLAMALGVYGLATFRLRLYDR